MTMKTPKARKAKAALARLTAWDYNRYTDEQGHLHGTCRCGADCSTHPDAGYSLDDCADCGAPTCPECRDYELNAPVCTACLAVRQVARAQDDLRDLHEQVICRLDARGDDETLAQAIEAVTGTGTGPLFDALVAFATGSKGGR